MNIRVVLPFHLRTLAHVEGEITIEADDARSALTLCDVLDGVEAKYPMLRGTIRDHVTKLRRPFIRFYIAGKDWSHESPQAPLPDAIATGSEPFMIIGAISGG